MAKNKCSKLKQMAKMGDYFSKVQLIRYKNQPQYNSWCGCSCSIFVFLAMVISFFKLIGTTFQRTTIFGTTVVNREVEPSMFSTKKEPFLIAIGIPGFNLNDHQIKYFNIQIEQRQVINSKKQTQNNLNFIPCQKQAWQSIDPSYGVQFDKHNMSQWLCLNPNKTMEFQGKYKSDIFRYVKISVSVCSPTPGDSRLCANQSYINAQISEAGGSLNLNYYYVNTIINPGNSNYIGKYFEDKNFFQFGQKFGTIANIFISTYQIQTDQSLWPLNKYEYENGYIIHEPAQSTPKPPSQLYIAIYLRKSTLSLYYTRGFQKYFDTLSYLGGLFTTIMAALLILPKYNEYSYEVQIASKIYKYDKNKKIQTQKFNFLRFFSYLFYSLLDFFNKAPDWQTLKHFDDARTEIGKQLNITFILKKLNFVENCLHVLFEEHQLKCLYLNGKTTLHEAAEIRRRFSIRSKLLKLKKTINNKQLESKQIINVPVHAKNKIMPTVVDELPPEFVKSTNELANSKKIPQQNYQYITSEEESSDNENPNKTIFLKEDLQDCLKKLQEAEDQRSKRIFKSLDKHIIHLLKGQFDAADNEEKENKQIKTQLINVAKKNENNQDVSVTE